MSVWLTANVWESDVNITNNTSIVHVDLYANWDWGSWNAVPNDAHGAIIIDGSTYTFTNTFNDDHTQTGSKLIKSQTKTVTHNADGTKTAACSAWYQTYVSSGQVNWSQNFPCQTIPRASTPSLSASTVTMGGSLTINISRAVSSFTHTLEWEFGASKGTIATGVATSKAWTVPLALANQIPNSTRGTGTIICKTYSGSKLIGLKTVAFTATCPTSMVPSISSVTLSEAVSGLAAKFGAYVQTKSKVKVVTAVAGSYSSSIGSIKVEVNGKSYMGSTITSDFLTTSGTVPVKVTVTDSRGRTATTTKNITVLAYTPPAITRANFGRATSATAWSDSGTICRGDITLNIAACNNKNNKSFKLEYKTKTATTWTQAYVYTDKYTFSGTLVTGAVFSLDSAYDLRFTVTDYFGSTVWTGELQTEQVLIDFRNTGRGIAFGKVSSKDRFECAIAAEFQAGVEPVMLGNGFDLNTLRTPGYYYSPANATVSTWLNCPTKNACTIEVLRHAGVMQRITEYNASISFKIFIRNFYNNAWGPWRQIPMSASETDAIIYQNASKRTYITGNGIEFQSMTRHRQPAYFDNNKAITMDTTGGSSIAILKMNTSNIVEMGWTQGGLRGRVRKTLWSGTWSSGSITVAEHMYYNIFIITLDGVTGKAICFRENVGGSGSYIAGGNISPFSGNPVSSYAASVLIQSTSATALAYKYSEVSHLLDNWREKRAILKIEGVL